MAEHRSRFFLATKTGERRGDAARAELERSLERLQVDSVDLIQLHNLVEPDEWDVAHGPGGAVEALVRARDEGLARFIGVTGHGTRIAGDAPAQPRAVPVRRGAAPVQLRRPPGSGLPGRRRGAARRLRGTAGGGADHQGGGPAPLAGRPRGCALQLVRAAPRRRGDRPGRALGARPPPAVPQHLERRDVCSRPSSRPRHPGDPGRPTTSCGATSRRWPCNRSSTGASSNASDSTHLTRPI